jgi:hypothetical protein
VQSGSLRLDVWNCRYRLRCNGAFGFSGVGQQTSFWFLNLDHGVTALLQPSCRVVGFWLRQGTCSFLAQRRCSCFKFQAFFQHNVHCLLLVGPCKSLFRVFPSANRLARCSLQLGKMSWLLCLNLLVLLELGKCRDFLCCESCKDTLSVYSKDYVLLSVVRRLSCEGYEFLVGFYLFGFLVLLSWI